MTQIRGYSNRTPKSSCASTRSSGTLTNDGHASSVDFSPRSLEKHCRPINDVIMETELKGTLIERLNHVEDRMIKVNDHVTKSLSVRLFFIKLVSLDEDGCMIMF